MPYLDDRHMISDNILRPSLLRRCHHIWVRFGCCLESCAFNFIGLSFVRKLNLRPRAAEAKSWAD